VPSTAVPVLGDQPYWGRRLAELGVGTPPIPLHRLTTRKLAAALARMTGDEKMTSRARDLSCRMAVEDGPGTGARVIADTLAGAASGLGPLNASEITRLEALADMGAREAAATCALMTAGCA
jgi:UDP:flavonoid glycosyltransferase YjiC (YdhE family)